MKCSGYKKSQFVHKLAKTYYFRGRGFHTSVEWKIGYKVINKQMIIQILIVNTAFYIFGDIRFKEISLLNSFEQIQENIIAGSTFSARLGSSAVTCIPDPLLDGLYVTQRVRLAYSIPGPSTGSVYIGSS